MENHAQCAPCAVRAFAFWAIDWHSGVLVCAACVVNEHTYTLRAHLIEFTFTRTLTICALSFCSFNFWWYARRSYFASFFFLRFCFVVVRRASGAMATEFIRIRLHQIRSQPWTAVRCPHSNILRIIHSPFICHLTTNDEQISFFLSTFSSLCFPLVSSSSSTMLWFILC